MLFGPVLLACLPGNAATAPGRTPVFPFANPSIDRLVIADLDGDRKLDTATIGASRWQDTSYVQDVTVQLQSTDSFTIQVRTPVRTQTMIWRDLDGDADRDLILESFAHEPLAVLLNDGDGHFHTGNLEDFRDRLRQRESRSLTAPASETSSEELAEPPSQASAVLDPAWFLPELASVPFVPRAQQVYVTSEHARPSSRGPPPSV